MSGGVEVSVVLGSYNRFRFLRGAIKSIRKDLEDIVAEIIIIDGGSDDGTLEWLTQQKDIITIIQHNRGKGTERKSWGYFMNLGFKCAHGKYICMLSDDCLVVPGAIKNGIDRFNDGVGAVAFYWRNRPEEKKYIVTKTLGNKLMVNHGLFLKKALESIGYIDETHFQFYHADADLCLRLWQAGYKIVDSPDSYIEHYSHANNTVRKTNTGSIKQDWESLVSRWDRFHFNRLIGRLGTTIERNYITTNFKCANLLYTHAFWIYRPLYFLYKGIKEKKELDALIRLVKPGMVAVDVGANTGFYTKFLSKLVGESGKVFAFEPEGRNFDHLQKETKNLGNVVAEQMAVGNKTGITKLYLSTELNVDHRIDADKNRKSIDVKITSLDDYFKKYRVNVIKTDTQGYDYFVVKGAKNLIRRSKKFIILSELWSWRSDKYLKLLKNYGFDFKVQKADHEVNFIAVKND